jgi:hypothetical protein
MRILVHAEQVERGAVDPQRPLRNEARVLGEEAVVALSVRSHVAQLVADDERVAVEHAE